MLPLYSTWRENAASIAVAAKLGASRYGDDFHLG
jgi:RimJ/RimL family protein N-acetyltransferase